MADVNKQTEKMLSPDDMMLDSKPVTKEQLIEAGKTLGELAVDATPIIGDVKAATELPEDIQLIKDLVSEGYDEGSIKKMGLGSLLGIATALGFVPAAGTLGDVTKTAIKKSVKKGAKPQPFQPEWRQKQIEQVKAKYKDSASRRQALREINRPAIKVFHGAKGMGEPINQKQYESTINDLSMYNNAYMDIPLKEIYGDADKISISDLNQSIGPKNLRFPTVVKTDSGPLVTYAVPKLRMSKSGNYAVVDLEVLDPAGDGIIDTVSNAIEVTDGKIDKSQILNLAADFEIEGVNTVFPNRDLKQSRAEQISNEGFLPYDAPSSSADTFEGAAGLSGERASGQHFELKEKALSTSRDPLVSMKPSFGGRSTQNIVYSDVDPKTVRDMPSEEYTDLVTFGQADPRKQNITKGDPKYIGASLPKSAHLEAETAITNPEMLTPKRLGTGDITEVTQAERGAKNIGQMDLEQRVATGQRLANNITQTLDKIKLDYRINKESDVFRVDNPVLAANNVYKTTNTLLRDLQSLGNFTEQYGARGTYDSILETAAKSYGLLLNIKDAAKVLPEGEKKINLSRTAKILEEIGSVSNSASSRATTGTRGLSDDVLKKALSGKDLDKETHNTLADAGIYISNKGKDLAFDPMKIGYNDLKRMLFLQTDKFNQGGLVMNEGGAVPMKNMSKQMELFEEGGLMEEGGMIDEESGNEVPPGSTREEVRDDIPAQLSEGEFVFPADVVRYHGLDKLMALRQEAKMGLQRMEDMGQMGNSEEAVLPDNIPFDIEDLDIEEDDEYNMAVGGYVPPAGSGIAAYQPSQFQQYQSQYTPYQGVQASQPIQAGSQQFVTPTAYQPPVQSITPVMQQPQLPKFEDFIATPTGQYDELREYKNATTGEVRQIPFVGGQPIYPIPEGFTYQDPEATATEEVTTTPTTGQTQVQTATGAGGERDDFSPTSATTAAAKSLGYKGGAAGKVNIPALVGGLIGGPLVGMGLSALKGFGADDEESTYGQPGTIDPATGAIFGQADIPGLTKNSANVAQGFNPVTGQPMATFSGTPSASYMKDKIAMAFGFAQNPNATFTGLQIIDPMAPTPLAEQGFKSTADIIRENTALSLQGPSVGIAGPQPVSPEKLGFSKNQASYGLASKNKGTYGSETGQISQTAFGLGVVNESGQIETPSGTVVQKTDPTTGKKHSLLGTKEQNKAVLDMIDKNIQNSKTVAQSLGMAADAAAAVSSGDNDGPNKGDFGNASSGTGSKGYGGGIGTGGGGKGESFGPHGGFNKGGNVTKQMKKSGLSSKK